MGILGVDIFLNSEKISCFFISLTLYFEGYRQVWRYRSKAADSVAAPMKHRAVKRTDCGKRRWS